MARYEIDPKIVEDIAREFCALEGLDPDREVQVPLTSGVNQQTEISPGVFASTLMHIVPQYEATPFWRTLIPEIERTYRMQLAFKTVEQIQLRLGRVTYDMHGNRV